MDKRFICLMFCLGLCGTLLQAAPNPTSTPATTTTDLVSITTTPATTTVTTTKWVTTTGTTTRVITTTVTTTRVITTTVTTTKPITTTVTITKPITTTVTTTKPITTTVTTTKPITTTVTTTKPITTTVTTTKPITTTVTTTKPITTTVTTTTPATTTTAPPTTTGACTDLPKAELTKLFNSAVHKAEWMVRPLGNLPFVMGPIAHSGVRVTLADGSQWLIHKGRDYGKDSDTVVTCASNMSNRWSRLCSRDLEGKKTVSDLVKAGGDSYNLLFNCHAASLRIMLQW